MLNSNLKMTVSYPWVTSLILCCTIGTLTSTTSASQNPDPHAPISGSTLSQTPSYGLEYETLDRKFIYNSIAPLIYTFNSPSTILDSFLDQLTSKYLEKCSNPSQETNSNKRNWLLRWCPLQAQINLIGQSLKESLGSFALSSVRASNEEIILSDSDCHVLRPHFHSFHTEEGVMDDYLEQLRNCSYDLFLHEDLGLGSLPNISAQLSTLRRTFEETFGEPYEPKTVFVNTELEYLTSSLLLFSTEAGRWSSALGDCKAGLIPSTLIGPDQLVESLEKISDPLRDKYDYSFLILPVRPQIGAYYKLPIADCTFSEDKLIVRLQVPVRSGIPELNTVWSLPFRQSGGQGQGHEDGDDDDDYQQDQICFVRGFDGPNESNFIHEYSTKQNFVTDCDPFRTLCYSPLISNSNAQFYGSNCLRALFSYPVNNQSLIESCPLTCRPIPNNNSNSGLTPDPALTLPLVRRVSRNTFHLVGSPSQVVYVQLAVGPQRAEVTDPRSFHQKVVSFPERGALRLTLPCGSQFYLERQGSNVTFFAERSCGQSASMENVLPIHWLNS